MGKWGWGGDGDGGGGVGVEVGVGVGVVYVHCIQMRMCRYNGFCHLSPHCAVSAHLSAPSALLYTGGRRGEVTRFVRFIL